MKLKKIKTDFPIKKAVIVKKKIATAIQLQ
jgi:hypothetical protein